MSGATAAGAEVIAAGNVPFATNYVRCTTGDGRACVMLGVEITLEVVGGFVVGRVASVIGRAGGRLLVRFVTRNGDEQIVAIPAEILERELVDTFGGPVEFDDAGRVVTDLVDDHGLLGDLYGPNVGRTGQQVLFDPGAPGRVAVPDVVLDNPNQTALFYEAVGVPDPVQTSIFTVVSDLPAPATFRGADGVLDLDAAAMHYAQVVNSNQAWSWELSLPDVPRSQQSRIRDRARELGLVSYVPYKPGTKYLDFDVVGMVIEVDRLPEYLWGAGRDSHFAWLDARLPGGRPPRTTWHHTEVPGRMVLVPFGPHNAQYHVGLADWPLGGS